MSQKSQIKEEIVRTADEGDVISPTKTIYDVSPLEVVWRNFLAGAGRTLGGIVIYFLLLFVGGVIIAQILVPQLQPLIEKYGTVLNPLKQLSSPTGSQIGH